ncbi:tstD [Scenedesmus sp. PABB004]|nr:tstD [Scenedesmus sp. PABB004]
MRSAPVPARGRAGVGAACPGCTRRPRLAGAMPRRAARSPRPARTLSAASIDLHDTSSALHLAAALELDGGALDGPDAVLAGGEAGAGLTRGGSRSRVRAAGAVALRASAGTAPAGVVRSLRSSSRTRASAASGSSASEGAAPPAPAAAAVEPHAHGGLLQQEQQQEQQAQPQHSARALVSEAFADAASNGAGASSSSGGSASASSSNGTGAAAHAAAAPVVAPAAPAAASSDDEYDAELQAEFAEARCAQDVLDIVGDELPRFGAHHTVTALNRVAKFGRGLPWEARRGLLGEPAFLRLLARLAAQAGQLNPMQLSTSLHSCAVLGVPLPALRSPGAGGLGGLLPALEAAVQASARRFNDRDVSSALYAYAQLGLRGGGGGAGGGGGSSVPALCALCAQAQSLIDRGAMGGQSLSMALWAAATLAAGGAGARAPPAAKQLAAAAGALAATAARRLRDPSLSFDELGSQGVANSLWAAAKLGQHEPALLEKGCEWVAGHLQDCKLQEVLNLLWAAGAGRYRPRVLGTIAKHVASQAQALKPADVASLLHVLGTFGYDFSSQPELRDALLSRGEALLPGMRPSEVASLYWGLGMTRCVTAPLFGRLTDTVAALVEAADAAQAALDAAGPQQPPRRGGRAADAPAAGAPAAAGGAAPPAAALGAEEVAVLRERARAFPDSLARQAFQAYLAARLEDAPVELPPRVLERLRGAWLAGNTRAHARGGGGGGGGAAQQQAPLLGELSWLLGQLGIKARVGVRSRLDGLIPVDVELTASGGRLVALQLLDERRLDADGGKLAPAQWEEAVLRRNGYDEVFWLRLPELRRVPHAARPRYFADLLRQLGLNPQERLLSAAEAAWARGAARRGGAGAGAAGEGAGLGMVGASGIRASEADLLMRDRGGGGAAGGADAGWASGGRGSRSRRAGEVVYERYYDAYSELDKAEVRAAFAAATDSVNLSNDNQDFVGAFREGCFVLIPTMDLVFYALGSGEYDEMALSGVLRVIMIAIADVVGKPPTESVFFEKYARIAAVIDEVINEGMLEGVSKELIRKGAKGKGTWE